MRWLKTAVGSRLNRVLIDRYQDKRRLIKALSGGVSYRWLEEPTSQCPARLLPGNGGEYRQIEGRQRSHRISAR